MGGLSDFLNSAPTSGCPRIHLPTMNDTVAPSVGLGSFYSGFGSVGEAGAVPGLPKPVSAHFCAVPELRSISSG